MATTVTFEVPDGYRIAAYLIPDTAPPVDVDPVAAGQIALADRVRTYGTDDNAAWLAARLPDPQDWFRGMFMGAVAMPIESMSWRQMTAGARRAVSARTLPREARQLASIDPTLIPPPDDTAELATVTRQPGHVADVCAGVTRARLPLRERRIAVAQMLADGVPAAEIAYRLQIARDTVYRHRVRSTHPTTPSPTTGKAEAA